MVRGGMANSVTALLQGHDYQARIFWLYATALRDPKQPHVAKVSYEADSPKAFDDVVVLYDPPRVSMGPNRISADHYQIKFHVTHAGGFGYEDLTKPGFIGAKTYSLLERLRDAKAKAVEQSVFKLVTIESILDGDPLKELLSATDNSLRLDKLFDGTGPRSRMGRVRDHWKSHLKMTDDAELRSLLAGFRILPQHRSLEQMRDEVNLRLRTVGLKPCYQTSEFSYDAAVRALKARGLYEFTREAFEALCIEEGWIQPMPEEAYAAVAVRTFSDGPGDKLDAPEARSLSLVDRFDGRHLKADLTWADLRTPLVDFLEGARAEPRVRIFLNAHASIAFLSGDRLGLKTGVSVELVQRGRSGTSVWRSDDGKNGDIPVAEVEKMGEGLDVALVISIARDALPDVKSYLAAHAAKVGKVVHLRAAPKPGPNAVAGGEHAAVIADAAVDAVRNAGLKPGATVHIFVAGPNAVSFFLGQHAASLGRWVVYEFDFERRDHGSYQPSFQSE